MSLCFCHIFYSPTHTTFFSFCSASLYIRPGLCYTTGSSFTSSPQGSGQVERKTYITLPVVSPSLKQFCALVCLPSAVSVLGCVRLMLRAGSICSELAEEVVKALVVRTLYKLKK
jgi:hypothetical protein